MSRKQGGIIMNTPTPNSIWKHWCRFCTIAPFYTCLINFIYLLNGIKESNGVITNQTALFFGFAILSGFSVIIISRISASFINELQKNYPAIFSTPTIQDEDSTASDGAISAFIAACVYLAAIYFFNNNVIVTTLCNIARIICNNLYIGIVASSLLFAIATKILCHRRQKFGITEASSYEN